MLHGIKDILCKLNLLNKKLQTYGETYDTVKAIVNATIAGLKRNSCKLRMQQETLLC
jgi:hypothetical protein